jgi:hypothetical protein
LTIMSAMSCHVAYWALNTICFQHNVRNRWTFIFYTIFSKFIFVNDLNSSTITMKQNIVRLFCKINNKRMYISFSNAFYVFECSFNLINFDQLNDLCSMTYKFEMFIVENQNIIAKKRVNKVFFFELWKHVSYNFVITFIVDIFEQISQIVNLDLIVLESIDSRFSMNKTILNIWHARLKHLRKQNVRRLTKMSKKMNLIKSIVNKDFCELCIIIKQKIESHNNFVILDKHSLNLMWSDLVESSISNDKTQYFVTFLCDFIKRSVIYVLRVKSDTFEAFRHFQLHNEHEDNRVRHLRTNWKKEYSSNEFDDYRFEHDIEWKSIISEIFEQNEIVERLKQIIMSMINIMLKNIDLNDKWWIELIKTINYFRNRSSMIDRSIILYEVDTKRNFFFVHLRRIETIDYVMKRKSITRWKKLIFRSFSIVLVNYEKNHIYRMLRLNEIIYRVLSIIWIKKKHSHDVETSIEISSKRSIFESFNLSSKKQVLKSNSITILISTQISQVKTSSFSFSLSIIEINTSFSDFALMIFLILNSLKRHFELRHRLDFFDSLSLLIMKCMQNVTNSQHVLKLRLYKKIMNDINRDEWLKIMKNENKFLLTNEIWILTNFFRNKRIFRDKWIYKIKRKKHDEILRHKTRWMIRDFEQIEKFNYTKTFVSMIKSMNYKTMYVIIVVNDWEIEQMNVKMIFLYDKIHENVFVVQFTKFEQEINKICKLNKTLYDFKQFSRVWFETLIKFLFSFDYVLLNVEFNVFMKNDIMIVIYVNDSIFIKFDSTIIFWLKNVLNKRFEMSDLNSCIYYFDMMIFRIRRLKLLFLNQSVYVEQMLRDHEMWDCKSLITLMNISCRLIKIFDKYTADKSLRINYQSIVKSLMYIMLKIRCDITYFISMISRYVFNLIQTHW